MKVIVSEYFAVTLLMEGVMANDISGTSILSNEFVVISRASTDNTKYFWSARQMWPQVAKMAQKHKS